MANRNGTSPLDDDTGEGLKNEDVAIAVLVGIIVFTGIGTLFWAIVHSLMLMFG